MAQNKPLPTLPIDLTALSVEARNHRAALIVHFLNDLHEPSIENQRDRWLYVFEDVLDNLGRNINSGEWLVRTRKGKELKRSLTNHTTKDSDTLKGAEENIKVAQGITTDPKELPEILRSSSLQPFQQLCKLASRPVPPAEEICPGHLLLCLAPHGTRLPLPTEDDGFDIVPANIGCTFSSGNFMLHDSSPADGTILFGLDGLESELRPLTLRQMRSLISFDLDNVLDTPLRLVGGTFTLKGVNSPQQHYLLAKVLKLAIYTHLSLILEQHLLSDSGIHLRFSQPKVLSSPSTHANTSMDNPKDKEAHLKARNSILPSSFTSFLSRHNIRYRSAETIDPPGNTASLDLAFPHSSAEGGSPRRSAEGPHEGHFGGRLRRLSFIGEKRYSFLRGHHRELPHDRKDLVPRPFTNTLLRIEKSRGLLSTSAGVTFASPKIIVDLSEKERARFSQAETQVHSRGQRLNVDERMALATLLGWGGKDAEGRGMSDVLGFLRQQEISVLCSVQLSLPNSKTGSQRASSLSASSTLDGQSTVAQSSTFTTASATTESSSNSRASGFVLCGKPCWVTYRYYSSNPKEDHLLGDWILDTARNKDKPCMWKSGCGVLQSDHDRILIHDSIKIAVRVTNLSQDWKDDSNGDTTAKDSEEDDIEVWGSCAICGAKTSKQLMSNGTRYLDSCPMFQDVLTRLKDSFPSQNILNYWFTLHCYAT